MNEQGKQESLSITPENMATVTLAGLKHSVKKSTAINGEKVEYTFNVIWTGKLLAEMIVGASMHQARNWYNNHRPSTQTNIMSPAECLRRENFLKSIEGKSIDVQATETSGARAGTKKSPMEIAELIKLEKDPAVKRYMTEALNTQQKELADAIASIQ